MDSNKMDMNENFNITLTPKTSGPRIIYLTMVKNESKIIQRSLAAASHFVDAFVVCDTGSTDDTVELSRVFIEQTGKPGIITKHEWKNFGHNRTLSFQACQAFVRENLGWDPSQTYCLLLDGDMVFRWTPIFDKSVLKSSGYSVIQKAGSLHYYNARLLRLSDNWKCVGATHEYWSGPGTENLPVEQIWIDDLNDGGSKSDKFIRDQKLLEMERDQEPDNPRTWFYLAQTYKDLGKLDESIKAYERRIEIGGWREEVWYSYYMIAKLYVLKNDLNMAELWANRGMEYYGNRAEMHYLLTRIYREKAAHFKAWYYYTLGSRITFPNDVLFLETNVYNGLFSYEASILHYYCFPQQRKEGLKLSLEYLNGSLDENKENVWNNLTFYVENIPSKRLVKEAPYNSIGLENDTWKMSSGSITEIPWEDEGEGKKEEEEKGEGGGDRKVKKGKYLVNMRHVNYICSEQGGYSSRDSDGIVRTQNAWMLLEDIQNGCVVSKASEFMKDCLELPRFDAHIQGLEDIRLWTDEAAKEVRFTAAAMDRIEKKKYRIIEGLYNWKAGTLENGRILTPPIDTECEKNWIQLGRNLFIYGWNPLIVCDGDGNIIHRTESNQLPWIFRKLRGSTGACKMTNGDIMVLCHSVHYQTPRKYLHYLIVMDSATYKVKKWSLPFSFTGRSVEYCLGMKLLADNPYFIVSRFDKDPVIIQAKLNKDFIFVDVK